MHWHRGLNPFWPHMFGLKPLLGLEPMAPNRPQLLVSHANHSATETCMYVEGRKVMFYLTTHSTHFIYGYMASDIWLRTILIVRKETCCRHIGYSFRLTARALLYAPSHRQDSTYHGLCYTSRGALAGTRNSSMGPPWMINPTTHHTMSENSYHEVTSRSMKDQSDDPSHHEWTLLPWSYISLPLRISLVTILTSRSCISCCPSAA